MTDFCFIHYGTFGNAVRTLCEHKNDNFLDTDKCKGILPSSIPTWLVMGQADLALIERTACDRRSILVAAFICGRYLVITPCLGPDAACAESFSRRFLSNPPPGLSSEAVFALATRAGVESGFDSPIYAPALPLLTRLLLKQQSKRLSMHAILIDQAGMQHMSAPSITVHGYRRHQTFLPGNRFTAFYEELFQ